MNLKRLTRVLGGYGLALAALVLVLAGCANPLPNGATNTVTIRVNPQTEARSGLIDVSTASSKADVYDIILYNASNTYRIVVSSIASPAVLTNVVPATYGVLVIAGKSNGSTKINGQFAAVLLGSGDVPYLSDYATYPLTGPGIITSGTNPSPTDGRGVTVAATGNTNISVVLQNIVYTMSATGATGTGTSADPFVVGIGNAFSVTFSYNIFLNLTSATGGDRVMIPLTSSNMTSNKTDVVTGSPLPTFVSASWGMTGLTTTNYTENFTAPSTGGGPVTIMVDSAGTGGSGAPGYTGLLCFQDSLLGSSAPWQDFFAITPQSGTAYDWYLPSDTLSTAMTAVGVQGSAKLNFSAPGASIAIGWGAGR